MDRDDKPSHRLASSRTFPVNLHHRHRSEITRPSNHDLTRKSNTTNTTTTTGNNHTRTPEERQPWPRRLFVDTSDLESPSSNEKKTTSSDTKDGTNDDKREAPKSHRRSKSRDHRLPRAVNQIASAGGARNLLPNRSFHRHTQSHGHSYGHSHYAYFGSDRDTIPELSFLKPSSSSREDASRSRFGSRSSSAHRNGGSREASLVVTEDGGGEDVSRKLSLSTARGRNIKTEEDLTVARQQREKGEEILRSKLARIGTLATDITRRLDYTYYNLLERMSTLHSTIHTFQDLVDSSAALHENFQRDNAALETEIHKQLADFAKFEPQRERIDELERRMKAGRSKMENLGERLNKVRVDIEEWEKREGEWQARVTQRLRVLGGFIAGLVVMIVVASFIRSKPLTSSSLSSTTEGPFSKIEMLPPSMPTEHTRPTEPTDSVDVDVDIKTFLKSPLLTKSAGENDETDSPTTETPGKSNPADALRLFDEL